MWFGLFCDLEEECASDPGEDTYHRIFEERDQRDDDHQDPMRSIDLGGMMDEADIYHPDRDRDQDRGDDGKWKIEKKVFE